MKWLGREKVPFHTLAQAQQMNVMPTPWISSPNAPNNLEQVPGTMAEIDAGDTLGHEAPHFSLSVAATRKSLTAGLLVPGQCAPWPVRGHSLKSYKCYYSSRKGRHY